MSLILAHAYKVYTQFMICQRLVTLASLQTTVHLLYQLLSRTARTLKVYPLFSEVALTHGFWYFSVYRPLDLITLQSIEYQQIRCINNNTRGTLIQHKLSNPRVPLCPIPNIHVRVVLSPQIGVVCDDACMLVLSYSKLKVQSKLHVLYPEL